MNYKQEYERWLRSDALSPAEHAELESIRKALTEIKKDEKNKDEKNKGCMRATIELSEVPVHLMASTLAPREARRRLL